MNEYIIEEENIGKAFVEQSDKNRELTASITLYRHQLELSRIEEMMADNKPIPTQNENKVKRTIIDNTVNLYRRMETQKLSEKKKQCNDSIDRFVSECQSNGIQLDEVITQEKLQELADSVFENDKFEFKRINFAMNLCLQEEEASEEFIFGDDTLYDVSDLLFGDPMRIEYIKDNFFRNFKELSNGNFWERNKYLLIASGVSLALISVLTPVALGIHAMSSAALTSCLAQIGNCAPGLIGTGIAKVTAMTMLSSAFIYSGVLAGVGVDGLLKSKQVKDAFRQLKPNDLAALLAMKATLINFGMENMDDDECKKELDKCLSSLNDLRADSEYMLIVEKSDADSSKKKIQICNRFVKRLAVCVGI
ncbi:MAG: hypothetical protein K2O31_02495 [Clostridia bacterium]|nr:hypothetical protein [Clostridia bacterium]MDE7208730.1 hypothetical protein [Clostridia bacterium]